MTAHIGVKRRQLDKELLLFGPGAGYSTKAGQIATYPEFADTVARAREKCRLRHGGRGDRDLRRWLERLIRQGDGSGTQGSHAGSRTRAVQQVQGRHAHETPGEVSIGQIWPTSTAYGSKWRAVVRTAARDDEEEGYREGYIG